jgi:hypothetical protein
VAPTKEHESGEDTAATDGDDASVGDLFEEDLRDEVLTRDEQDDLNEAEGDPVPVVFSSQDFDADGLVRRLNNENILVPGFGHEDDRITSAGFQRSFVWTRPQMDRFIESLLLGYPIPGVFFIKQSDKRYLVLDGQQRLRTLQAFFAGMHQGREFALQNVGVRFRGLTYAALQEDQRRMLDNSFIQATIVTTDGSDESLDSIYQIFERLNAGGTQLTPHEIRVALYAGPFIDYLEKLNKGEAWRELYGRKSQRIRDQELVLRIAALFYDASSYSRPLKTFLNEFTRRNRRDFQFDPSEYASLFEGAAHLILAEAGRASLRPRGRQMNSALTEALFIGLMRRLQTNPDVTPAAVARAISRISGNKELTGATIRSTADEESVKTRLQVATDAFRRI